MHHVILRNSPVLECRGVEFFPERTGLELRIVISEGYAPPNIMDRASGGQTAGGSAHELRRGRWGLTGVGMRVRRIGPVLERELVEELPRLVLQFIGGCRARVEPRRGRG